MKFPASIEPVRSWQYSQEPTTLPFSRPHKNPPWTLKLFLLIIYFVVVFVSALKSPKYFHPENFPITILHGFIVFLMRDWPFQLQSPCQEEICADELDLHITSRFSYVLFSLERCLVQVMNSLLNSRLYTPPSLSLNRLHFDHPASTHFISTHRCCF
jgi:hypothetical protein